MKLNEIKNDDHGRHLYQNEEAFHLVPSLHEEYITWMAVGSDGISKDSFDYDTDYGLSWTEEPRNGVQVTQRASFQDYFLEAIP